MSDRSEFQCVEPTHERFNVDQSPYGVSGVRIIDLPKLCVDSRYWVRRVVEYFFHEEIDPTVYFEVLGFNLGPAGFINRRGRLHVKVYTLPFSSRKLRTKIRDRVVEALSRERPGIGPEHVTFHGFEGDDRSQTVIEIEM